MARRGVFMLELLIVMAIIVIVAVSFFFIYRNNLEKSYDSKRKSDLYSLSQALEEYEKDNENYPQSLPQCNTSTSGSPLEGYIGRVPCDPKTDQNYIYEVGPTQTNRVWYRIYSQLSVLGDPDIEQIGCGTGCGPGDAFNYYVSSPNSPGLATIGYIPNPPPTSTPTNTPTPSGPTSTPTSTPTPTPTPAMVTLQIAAGPDDVNEEGTNFFEGPAQVWIGYGGASPSILGLRFTNVPIAQGKTILSAHLEFYSTSTTSISTSAAVKADDINSSAAFSSGNRPSARTLTSAGVNFSTSATWNINTWYSLPEMNTVLQEVISRPGWVSGNAMSVILTGSGATGQRRVIRSYNGAPANSARLVITYLP